MRTPASLPDDVPPIPFPSRLAPALGVSKERLRRGDVCRPRRGVVSRLTRGARIPGEEEEELRERAVLVSLAIDDEHAFSHDTALELLELPTVRIPKAGDRIHVTTPTTRSRIRVEGVLPHKGLETRSVVQRHGLRVVGEHDTWCDLGERIRVQRLTVGDLVMVGDAILRRAADVEVATRRDDWRWEPDSRAAKERIARAAAEQAREQLAVTLASRVRPRGKVMLLQALPLLRHRSKSPQESRARLVMLDEGLPEPLLNQELFAADGSGLLGEFDFVWERPAGSTTRGVVAEYQGEHHAERRQRSADEAKRGLAEDDGWVFVPIWAEDLSNLSRRHTMVARIRAGLALAPDPRRSGLGS